MESSPYHILKIHNVLAHQEDLLVSLLFELGASGVQENLEFVQQQRNYQPEVVDAEIKSLLVYFESVPQPQLREHILSQFPEMEFELEQHQTEDWLKKWKEQWKPFELIENVWIVPSWHQKEFQQSSKQSIYIEPGMAFGTGTHPTTQLAAQMLQSLVDTQNIQSMVDVGTGSGILSFLANLMGVKKLYAYDNDPESHRVFHENLQNNPHSATHWVPDWSKSLSGDVDLTMANIIDGVLLNLKSDFMTVNSRYYIFTGILQERENLFLEEMLIDFPLQTLKRIELDGWVGYLMERSQ